MPPIEFSPIRPVVAVARAANPVSSSQVSGKPAPANATGELLDPGAPPIDAERVSAIRSAIRDGTYPFIPSRVADAVIASGLLLEKGE